MVSTEKRTFRSESSTDAGPYSDALHKNSNLPAYRRSEELFAGPDILIRERLVSLISLLLELVSKHFMDYRDNLRRLIEYQPA
jgi:hypothetical protein